MHDGIDAFEQRLEVGTGNVDPVELEVPAPPSRLAHIERDDVRDVGMFDEQREEPLPHETHAPVTAIAGTSIH